MSNPGNPLVIDGIRIVSEIYDVARDVVEPYEKDKHAKLLTKQYIKNRTYKELMEKGRPAEPGTKVEYRVTCEDGRVVSVEEV